MRGPSALFVYGTLMRGESHHHLLAGVVRVEPARATGRLYALPEGYPALVDVGDEPVDGDLVVLEDPASLWPALDAYEGVEPGDDAGSLYRRVVRSVVTASEEQSRAWCYVMPGRREAQLVSSGAVRVRGRWTIRNTPRPRP